MFESSAQSFPCSTCHHFDTAFCWFHDLPLQYIQYHTWRYSIQTSRYTISVDVICLENPVIVMPMLNHCRYSVAFELLPKTMPKLQALIFLGLGRLPAPAVEFPWQQETLLLPLNMSRTITYNDQYSSDLALPTLPPNIFRWVVNLDCCNHDDVIKWKHCRVTGHLFNLCGEFTGHRWITRSKASDAELWCFLWSASE